MIGFSAQRFDPAAPEVWRGISKAGDISLKQGSGSGRAAPVPPRSTFIACWRAAASKKKPRR
jgi:hypothetical protein